MNRYGHLASYVNVETLVTGILLAARKPMRLAHQIDEARVAAPNGAV